MKNDLLKMIGLLLMVWVIPSKANAADVEADTYVCGDKVCVSFYNPNPHQMYCSVKYAYAGYDTLGNNWSGTNNGINGHFYGEGVYLYSGYSDYELTPPATLTFTVQWLRTSCKKSE